MFEGLGRRRYAVPLVVLVVSACVMAMVVYPMLTATPRNVPLAVLSLDGGTTTPKGDVNLGAVLVERILASGEAADGEDPVVAWTEVSSQADLDAALDAEEYYAAIIIPEGFSAASVSAQAGAGEALPITVIVDQGKNPMVASTVETMLGALVLQAGVPAEFEYIDSAAIGGGALNMAQQFTILPVFIMSMLCSVALFAATKARSGATRRERLARAGVQLGYAAVLSCCIGYTVAVLVHVVSGLDIAFSSTGLFTWLASFCLIVLFVGCLDLAVPLGAFVIFACFAGGMATGNLPYELQPEFWQTWLYPWVPQHWIGEGVRQIYYTGAGAWNDASMPLLWTGLGGLLALAAAILVPRASRAAVPAEESLRRQLGRSAQSG